MMKSDITKRLAALEEGSQAEHDGGIVIVDLATGVTRRLTTAYPGGLEIIVRRGAAINQRMIASVQPGLVEQLIPDTEERNETT
jgi:hypothetical protein